MTENEALQELNERIGLIHKDYREEAKEYKEVLETAITALSEIQQYRAIGTVKECQKSRERQTWNIITEDVDSYPECFKNVLVEDEYGDKNIAYCDTEFDWFISNCENSIKLIGEVVKWIEID